MNLIDLYQTLFGKDHISDGDVISMAEHGRAGGISTGTPFKGVQEIPLQFLMDLSAGNAFYMGESKPGVLSSQSYWRIAKMVIDGSNISIIYADGTDKFDKEGDERANYTYEYI